MRLLLDTHTFLWWVFADKRLSQTAKNLIADIGNESHISLVTAWELSIKAGLKKLAIEQPVSVFFPEQLSENGFQLLNLNLSHVFVVEQLAHHHRDPFERLLIAQAQAEKMSIISADIALDKYEIERLW